MEFSRTPLYPSSFLQEKSKMSTRGCIARLTSANPIKFKGVYHHWDSDPPSLGKHLWNRIWNYGLRSALEYIIDEHPAGWSSLQEDKCYCHRDRKSPPFEVNEENFANMMIEWVYAFDKNTMYIMIPETRGQTIVAKVKILGPEPDWKEIAAKGEI